MTATEDQARDFAQERLDRATALGIVALVASADVQFAWRATWPECPSPNAYVLRERTVDWSGKSWAGGVVELVYASRVVLSVGYPDAGRNQPVLVRYLPDGVVGAWERGFVGEAWDAIRNLKILTYDEAVNAPRGANGLAWTLENDLEDLPL